MYFVTKCLGPKIDFLNSGPVLKWSFHCGGKMIKYGQIPCQLFERRIAVLHNQTTLLKQKLCENIQK